MIFKASGMGPVAGQHVEFVEAALVQQVVDTFAGQHLSFGVLAFNRALTSGMQGLLAAREEIVEAFAHGCHGAEASRRHLRGLIRPRVSW